MKDFFKIRTPLAEEHGAGEQGTPSLVSKYKNATPEQQAAIAMKKDSKKPKDMEEMTGDDKSSVALQAMVARKKLQQTAGKNKSQAFIDKMTSKANAGDRLKYLKKKHGMSEATAQEKDIDPNKKIVVKGVKGMKSTPFIKKFRNMAAYDKWSDSDEAGNYEVMQVMNESVEQELLDEDYKQQDDMYRKEAVKHAERVMKAIGSGYISGCKYHARALQDMADDMENTIEYRKSDEKRMKAMKSAGVSRY